jgi:LacI family transcriptional regulator
MAVSQKQIAERVGVSIALVSRVLSGKARAVGIADATIEKVMKTAAEMGYVPSAAALTLKGKSSRTIGVVVYDFLDPFFGAIIGQLQALAHEQNYSLVIAGFKGRHPEESDLAPLRKHAIDGLIVIGSAATSEWLSGFTNKPVVRIGHGRSEEESCCVALDERDAAQQLVNYLVGAGYRNLAFIGGNLFSHSLRYDALDKAGRMQGIEVENNLWVSDGFDAGQQATRSMLSAGGGNRALICATDTIAMGALHALYDAKIDLPVTGYDDIPAAAQFIPPVTTVRQPIEDLARRAFSTVVEACEPGEILLKGKLIIRSSA